LKTLPHLFENNCAWAEAIKREDSTFSRFWPSSNHHATIVKNAWKQGRRLVVHGWTSSLGDGILHQQVPEIDSLRALAAARCDDVGWVVLAPR
jgi:carbonic anhydrase